ncbi:related to l-asparaginase [Sporisorium reilianum SRZ2]|uniref:asparaginase n=1 Tax=Sporisorium reilianum (strain SRZ2) TaxID=999809 RepID=E6ZT54_SPORE|nr:related to l-asparaginase [Sporisorium reilianum SRZ2]
MSSSGEALVLCLYAGGTIGMVRKDASSGFAPYPSFLTETFRSQSRFHDPHGDSIFSWSDSHLELQLPTLITPRGGANGKRVRYAVLEYDPLLDSSEMDIPDWIRLATDISLNYQNFDAFIVLHGTDTMAYTASALSMLLENLGKSVIVTGAQVPLSELRNDAIENVLGALMLAGSYIIPEVGLYFASTLYRGNRTSKVSNNALAAFDSPNMAPLARVGINIEVAWNLVERSRSVQSFRAHNRMSPNVALLRLFPGLPTSTVQNFLSPPLQGVVLESYGAGNAPSRQDLLDVFKEASDRGCVIVNITQCVQGEVSAIYAVGKKLEAVGVVAGGDMTPECALAKLSYLLAKELEPAEIRELMGRPLRGELTSTRGGSATVPQERTPAGAGPIKADVKTLLAHILQSPHKLQPSALTSPGKKQRTERTQPDTDANTDSLASAAGWDSSSHEVSAASLAVLPFLIYEAASKNDVALLQWHLYALNQLEAIPAISIDEEHFHPSTLNPSSASTATGDAAGTHMVAETVATTPLEKLQPLHVASAKGYTAVVELLLQAGCSVHARHVASGHSPLFLACKNANANTARLLRNAGAHLKEDEVRLARFLVSQHEERAAETNECRSIWELAGVSFA